MKFVLTLLFAMVSAEEACYGCDGHGLDQSVHGNITENS